MDVIPGPVRCRQCDAVLDAQPWNMCVLCAGVFCATHLIERNGVTTCRECEPERLAREAESTVRQADRGSMCSNGCTDEAFIDHDMAWRVPESHRRIIRLWFSGGGWRCEQTGEVVAGLGALYPASK